MFDIIDKDPNQTIIKVIGVGGAGGNAVEHMIREGVQGVEFICANTDAQALKQSSAGIKLQFGPGLGAGGKPEKARDLAEVDREAIAQALQGANMVFITAGMGGGTGTGAAPIVAEVSRELGILTVAVVTKPFEFEGRRMKLADDGLIELGKHVDSLIVVLNQKLMEVMGEDITMEEAFHAADNVLKNAVGGIAEIINIPGLVNVDFEDVRTVMSEMGKAMMGSASASGVDRARIAAEQAVVSPLLEGIELSGARGVLVNIAASRQLGLKEVREVMATIRSYTHEEATIIFGTVFDEAMEDQLRVTVVATGLGGMVRKPKLQAVPTQNITYGLRTGTDDMPMCDPMAGTSNHGSGGLFTSGRGGNNHNAAVKAMTDSGMDKYEIPAFLRRQAD
ncbi:MAG: cell division protein FtsZ [Rhodocyclaceae bacterium]|nr:cell division protein FtsZ [Rhodocyclaceae bacterium]